MYPIFHRLTCASTHCVYLIFCDRCGKQYVGQSSLRLGTRIAQHVGNIRHSPDLSTLTAHFNGPCSPSDVRFFAIERAPAISTRLSKEEKWIRRLRTVAPHGLNDVAGTKVRKYNLVTRPSQCTDRLNSTIRRLCGELNVPFRCAYSTDRNLCRYFT